ncbi:MAG: hypothetical protein LBF15_02090 [Candidatus Peribacteria bacterium]|nr:hypothetical protein [Candidatus Peribacteria bacterium]
MDSIARDSSEIKSIGDLIAFVKNPYKEKIKTEIKSIIIKTMFCCRDYGDNQLESKKAQIEEILKIFTDTPK